jgi:hypothetical protein
MRECVERVRTKRVNLAESGAVDGHGLFLTKDEVIHKY